MINFVDRTNSSATRHQTFTIASKPIEPGQLDARHILTPEQLAERLQVPVSWVYEQTRNRMSTRTADPVPNIRMGKYLRFYWPEVEKWLERRQGGQNGA
jgi:predicted DNA-binding transcriptional regulator AlpA